MTRSSKSYRSSTPKEPKETRAAKQKRLENYRIAKNQAKKFVIPGIIAIIASLFFLFVAMYGFKGTKMKGLESRGSSKLTDQILERARENLEYAFKEQEKETPREHVRAQILEALREGDLKWNQDHPEQATQDYDPAVPQEKLATESVSKETVIE
ncbi:hypothetical protein FBU30_008233 [Linnemannia zychae]|nr:hypothetical protein FBU30_008233 [Linnemannia zychae]